MPFALLDRLFQSQKHNSEIDSWKISTNSAPWWGSCACRQQQIARFHLRALCDCQIVPRTESFFNLFTNAARVSSDVSHCAWLASYLASSSRIARQSVKQLHQRVLPPFFVLSPAASQPCDSTPKSLENVSQIRHWMSPFMESAIIARETKTALAWKFPQEWFTFQRKNVFFLCVCVSE